MKNNFLNLCMFALLVALTNSACKPTSKSGHDALILGMWECENIEKGGRVIDIKSIAGEVFMEFSKVSKKDSKTGKTKITNRFRMEMGGSDRFFDYQIVGDSIQFIGVKGWNDYRIINLDKDKLKLDQNMDGDLVRWNLKPRPDLTAQKEKEKKSKDKKK